MGSRFPEDWCGGGEPGEARQQWPAEQAVPHFHVVDKNQRATM